VGVATLDLAPVIGEAAVMLYLREFLTLLPATPASQDRLIELMQTALAPCYARLGARLQGAFISNAENWGQVIHLIEFEDLAAFADFRERASADPEYGQARAALDTLAPESRSELLETLSSLPASMMQAAIDAAHEKPVGAYTFAELELAPGKARQFEQALAAAKDHFPIIAALRGVTGNPRMVIDLWKGALGQGGYKPATKEVMAFFGPLRELAPRERLVNLFPLPYSPLR
jgi:hypothetical protein